MLFRSGFFDKQLAHYRYSLSSPLSAEDACSRLSPYIAHGVISIRELMHKVWKMRAQVQSLPEPAQPKGVLASLKSFESRLHWHCHFIQKLESEPALEWRNLHPGYDGLREGEWNEAHFQALVAGRTGWPLVDACVAMLRETGWINRSEEQHV